MSILVGLAIGLIGLCVLIGLVALVHLAFANRNVVPAVFTPREALDELMKALDLPNAGQFVDLGCGDGRVLAEVGRRKPRLTLLGVENNPVVWLRAKWRLGGRAKIKLGQIEQVKLGEAKRVFTYLGPGLMADLEPRFERELPRGARVVSQQFPLPHRQVDRVVELAKGKPYALRLYVYHY